MKAIHKFSGLHYLWLGFTLITKPKLRLFVLIPLLINFLLFVGFILVSIHYFHEIVSWVDHFLPHWLQWLNGLLWLLLIFGMGLIWIFCFTTVANTIGAPFYSVLAIKVELYLTNQIMVEESWAASLQNIPRTLMREWEKFAYYLPRALLCLILFFVPIIQIAAGIIWFLFNAWNMALQYLDYSADNHKMPFKTFRNILSQHRMPTLGFGMGIMLLSLIPIVNCFLMPAAVAGSTAMWLDILGSSLPNKFNI